MLSHTIIHGFTVLIVLGRSEGKFLQGRTECPEGYVLWPVDMTCHRPFSQGPCLPYQQLIADQEGTFCKNIQASPSDGAWSIGSIFGRSALPEIKEKLVGWRLPTNESEAEDNELDCLSKGQVFWPEDQQCYDLLSAGPCGSEQWLVLEKDPEDSSDDDQHVQHRVVCKQRACPCDAARPEFCEVEMREGSCKCRVALAAAQDGVCDAGEQLLLDPYGFGVCGCIVSPPHSTWPADGKCYPLYTQGPCAKGYQLSKSPSTLEPSCRPAICGNERSVLWEDGECYPLGEQGPCENVEVLTIDEETLEPKCHLLQSKVKRLFDAIPGGYIQKGPVSVSMKAHNCILDRRGKCKNSFRSYSSISRKRKNKLYIRRRKSSRNYINWLKQFKQR